MRQPLHRGLHLPARIREAPDRFLFRGDGHAGREPAQLMGGAAHEPACLRHVPDDLGVQRREQLEEVAQPFGEVPGPFLEDPLPDGEAPDRLLLGRGELGSGHPAQVPVFPRQFGHGRHGLLLVFCERPFELVEGGLQLLGEGREVPVREHGKQAGQQGMDAHGVLLRVLGEPLRVPELVVGEEASPRFQPGLGLRRQPFQRFPASLLQLPRVLPVAALGPQQDLLLLLEDLLQLVAGLVHGSLHPRHHGRLGLLLPAPEGGRQLRHLVEQLPRQLQRALDVALPELPADLVHDRAHVGEGHVPHALRVEELAGKVPCELHERSLELLELPGQLRQFLQDLVELLVAAPELFQRIEEALLALDHVPGVGLHVLAREPPAHFLAEHGHALQVRGHFVVRPLPLRRGRRLAHVVEQLGAGVFEVALQGLQVGPGGEVAHPVAAGARHHLVHALHHPVEPLGQPFFGGRFRPGRRSFGRGAFEVIRQQVHHLVRQLADHLRDLSVLGFEVLEPEAEGPRLSELGTRDGVVVEYLQVVGDHVALVQAHGVQVPHETVL